MAIGARSFLPILAAVCPALWAQERESTWTRTHGGPWSPQFWAEGLMLKCRKDQAAKNEPGSRITIERTRNGLKLEPIRFSRPCPGAITSNPDFFEGRFILAESVLKPSGTPEGMLNITTIWEWEGGTWRKACVWMDPRGRVRQAFGLGNGHFLCVGRFPSMDQASVVPFAILAPKTVGDEERLRVGSLPDWRLEQPLARRVNGKSLDCYHPFFWLDVEGVWGLRTEGRIILMEAASGYLWVFDDQDGRLLRLDRVHRGVDEDRLRTGHFRTCILWAQPTPDHTILLSRRSKDYVVGDRKLDEQFSVPRLDLADPDYVQKSPVDLMNKFFPEVEWEEYDPRTGIFGPHNQGSTAALPSLVNGMNESMAFKWQIEPDRSIQKWDRPVAPPRKKPEK